MFKLFVLALTVVTSLSLTVSSAKASSGLIVHTTEFGVGKFHRYDNQVHAYGAKHAWAPYILAQGAATDKALIQKNTDGSFTVFFSTLDEMMASVVQISRDQNQKVSVLNVHGHGLPGAMWFPKDDRTLKGFMCGDWRQAANGSDVDNYNQYYGAVTVADIMQIRQVSNNPNVKMGCTTGASEWREGVTKNPDFRAALHTDVQLHFISCVVGLGTVGDAFTKEIAAIVVPVATGAATAGHVQTSMAFGLGDWSMPEGMGFWDYQSDEQVRRDNANYGTHKNDREIAQKGAVRMASFANGAWTTGLLPNRDFMSLGFETSLAAPSTTPIAVPTQSTLNEQTEPMPTRVRVPGTNAYVTVEAR